MSNRLISFDQTWAALLALTLASLLSCALLAVRALYAGELLYGFFVWNLFLAWVPALAALLFYSLAQRRPAKPVPLLCIGIIWLLFFPNAAYVITDIQHLYERPPVPYWYDMIAMMAFAQTGLFLGYLSLYLMQEVVRSWLGALAGWAFALAMLALSSFGIYLGRFLRWNSWDALQYPLNTLVNAARAANPWVSLQPIAFCITFFAFSLVCYLIVYSFTHLHGWTTRRPP